MDISVIIGLSVFGVMAFLAVLIAIISAVATASSIESRPKDEVEDR